MRPEPAPVQHKTVECRHCFKWYIAPCVSQAQADGCTNFAAAKMLVREGGTLIGEAKHLKPAKGKKAKPKAKPKRKR